MINEERLIKLFLELCLINAPALGEKDVVDGVSEVMNIVAGKVKSHMAGRDGQLQLGLPMFVVHPIAGGSGMEVASADVTMGPVPVRLSIYRRALAARRAA